MRRADAWREVVLTDVHPVGPGSDRDVGSVVEDEERAVAVGRRAKGRAPAEQIAGLGVLLAQLHDVDARVEHRVEKGFEVALRLPRVGDEVEAGARQPLPPRVTRTRHHRGRRARPGRLPRSASPSHDVDAFA